jgi:hypothetical protein
VGGEANVAAVLDGRMGGGNINILNKNYIDFLRSPNFK